MRNLVLLLIMLCAVLPGFAQDKTWKKQVDTRYFYSVTVPPNWNFRFQDNEGTRFFVTSAKETEDDRFVQNINLQARKGAPSGKFKDYVNQNLNSVKSAVGEFEEISSRFFKWNGREAFEIEYTGKIEQVPYRLHWKQRYIFHRGATLVFTYTADGENEDGLRPVADKIMQFIKFN